jgi:chemotaxis protein methyltransferase CheR
MPTTLHSGAALDLSRACGLNLSAYRAEHVAERVKRALAQEGVATVDELAFLMLHDSEARRRFRRSIAMVVSGLFRDPAQFALIERELLPSIVGTRRTLRIWSAGCADGSELYSVGIVLAQAGHLEGATLLGSDLLEENLAVAAEGIYGDVQLPAALRAAMRWECRDLLVEPPPPGKWSLVLCRNLAIYLRSEAKERLHRQLAGVLAPHGVLLLGRSERVSDPQALGLEPVAPHAYRRVA